MRRIALVLAVAAAAAAALATSATASKTSVVPPYVQGLIKTKAGALAYVPTRVPIGYRYRAYAWSASAKTLVLRFSHKTWPQNGRHTFRVKVERFGRPLSACPAGKTKTLQMDGNKVYWDGTVAWRCLRAPGGPVVKVSAWGPNMPDAGFGTVLASVKRVR